MCCRLSRGIQSGYRRKNKRDIFNLASSYLTRHVPPDALDFGWQPPLSAKNVGCRQILVRAFRSKGVDPATGLASSSLFPKSELV